MMIKLLRFGEAKGNTPLVAVPGIDGSIGSIKPLVDGFSKHREVIVVDYTEGENATLNDLADEIYAKLKAEMDEPFHLSGQSIGTIVASKLDAKDLPIQKVVLTGTFINLNDMPLKVSAFFMNISPNWMYRVTTRPVLSYVCGPVRDGKNHPFFETSKNSDKNDIARRTRWLADADFTDDLKRIRSPLLILMGEKDRYVPDATKEIRKLRDLFKDKEDCRIEVLKDAGHVFLPAKSIESAIEEINRFLQ